MSDELDTAQKVGAGGIGTLGVVGLLLNRLFGGLREEVSALRAEVAALRVALAAEADSRETKLEQVRERLEKSGGSQRGQLDDHATRLGRVEGYLGALGSGPAELKGRGP
jgi:hypothetical protein